MYTASFAKLWLFEEVSLGFNQFSSLDITANCKCSDTEDQALTSTTSWWRSCGDSREEGQFSSDLDVAQYLPRKCAYRHFTYN